MVAPPLDELQWKSPEWIQSFGLNTHNVLSYFSESPFFDRTSNNQVLLMQAQYQENFPMESLNSVNIINELKKLTGVEYVVLLSREPDFWIIRKQIRKSPEMVESMADYYVIGANVYMCPNIHDMISNRLLSTAYALKNGLSKLQNLATYSPSDGHSYKYQENPNTAGPQGVSGTTSRSRPGVGNTPYTPSVNETPGGTSTGNSGDVTGGLTAGLSKGTVTNLFNISLSGEPVYLEEEPEENYTGILNVGANNPFNAEEIGGRSMKRK